MRNWADWTRCGASLLLVSWVGLRGLGAAEEPLSPTNRLELFNHRNLDGWYSWLVDSQRADPRRVFTVREGCVRISGDGLGYLATQRTYRDYRLLVEWRWGLTNSTWGDRVGRARDSGIFLHATGPDGNSHDGRGAFMAAIESNVFEGAVGDFLLIRGNADDGTLIAPRLTVEAAPGRDADGWYTWQRGGRSVTLERWGRVNWAEKSNAWQDVTGFHGPREAERPRGQWNQTEIVCSGNRIRTYLNGRWINAASEVWPSSGRILLQCEGSEIYFQRVELRPLRIGAAR